jgi:hypothetical protein
VGPRAGLDAVEKRQNHCSLFEFVFMPNLSFVRMCVSVVLCKEMDNFRTHTHTHTHTAFVGKLGYGLDDRGSRVRIPAGTGNFSLHHRVRNGSGAHPASYPMGTRGSFPGGKAAGA